MNTRTYTGRIATTALLLLFLFDGMAAGADDYTKDNIVYNKLKFLDWLIYRSPTTERISSSSSDAEAIEQLHDARDFLQQAQQEFDTGELGAADESIAAGLKLMTNASRKVRDNERVEQARRDLYHKLKKHVNSFERAFDRVAAEKSDRSVDAMLDRKELDAQVLRADTLFTEGQLALANHVMKQATDLVEAALSGARHNEVLLHELSFDSPEDEYTYEKQRNQSYLMLIGMLLEGSETSAASRDYVNGIVSSNGAFVDQAEISATNRDYAGAISMLEKANDKLSRALRMSGASF